MSSILGRVRARMVMIAIVLLSLLIPTQVASAAGSSGGPGRTKPTIVLVHGAWADGSGWSGVVERLQRRGYPVRVPPNPLRSLPGDSATVADFLSTLTGPIVLVAHSYGGAVITNAATGNAAVKALVYVDAFAPEQGETVLPLAGADSALAVDPTTVFDFVPYPGAPTGDVDLYLKQTVFLESFANGIPERKALVLYATQRPITFSSGNQPSGVPAWKTIPSWYLIGTQDKIIPPAQQRFMAERAHARIEEAKSGHLAMVSHPDAVTDLILSAVRATG
ncbi:MAG TPA: alpha/beta hydrolase [Actinoplanes sp.]|nr:alpha/beta hydrolase [Actinoplanes sp.]